MIAYFDTSAFVPLLLVERGTDGCRDLWDHAESVMATRLLYAEAAAALARAERSGRIGTVRHARALDELDFYWGEVQVLDVDDPLVRAAAAHARRFALRGYDSVHCAAATLAGPDLVAASGDRRLLAAWQELGVATFDANRS